jgi:hypothetical protein
MNIVHLVKIRVIREVYATLSVPHCHVPVGGTSERVLVFIYHTCLTVLRTQHCDTLILSTYDLQLAGQYVCMSTCLALH